MANENAQGFGSGHMLLAFFGGAAVGAVTAILMAPASGAETRSRLSSGARRRKDELASVPPALKSAYTSAAEAARDAFVETYRATAPTGES